jgi:hypothetical protein
VGARFRAKPKPVGSGRAKWRAPCHCFAPAERLNRNADKLRDYDGYDASAASGKPLWHWYRDN